MIIDSHQHFWRLETGYYDWIPPADGVLRRNFESDELAPQLRAAGVDGTILVQAANTEDELAELAAHAQKSGFVRGIVAPLQIGLAGTAERIGRMRETALLVGFRPPFAQIFDADGNVAAEAHQALSAMAAHGLVLDCLAVGEPLQRVPELAKRYPGLNVVVDHGGNPNLVDGKVGADWVRSMTANAAEPNCVCKLSGLWSRLPADADRAIVVEHVGILLDLFGPRRLMWGSDWPVLTKADRLENWLNACQDMLSALDASDREAVFGGNAVRVYRLGTEN